LFVSHRETASFVVSGFFVADAAGGQRNSNRKEWDSNFSHVHLNGVATTDTEACVQRQQASRDRI
jgi:hypothetical protein